jgi:hypothetical protein
MAKIKVNCSWCGKEKEVSDYQAKQNVNHRFFCNRDCQGKWKSQNFVGENNPHWNSVKVKCDFCGIEIDRSPSEIKNLDHYFCDKKCFRSWQGTQQIPCAQCGKLIPITKHEIGRSKDNFCDRKCFAEWKKKLIGEKNHSWKPKRLIECANCGKELEIGEARFKSNQIGKFFCNTECKGEYQHKYIHGANHHSFSQVEVPCSICGRMVLVQNHMAQQGKKHFCSDECCAIWRSQVFQGVNNPNWNGGKWIPCEVCGKEKWVLPSRQLRGEDRFCSKECFGVWLRESGRCLMENNPNWQGGISFEPYSKDFNDELKNFIREYDGYKCQICGIKQNGRKLSIHHIDYNKKNNDEENLISLCLTCHMKTNFNREYWIEYFKPIMASKYSAPDSSPDGREN